MDSPEGSSILPEVPQQPSPDLPKKEALKKYKEVSSRIRRIDYSKVAEFYLFDGSAGKVDEKTLKHYFFSEFVSDLDTATSYQRNKLLFFYPEQEINNRVRYLEGVEEKWKQKDFFGNNQEQQNGGKINKHIEPLELADRFQEFVNDTSATYKIIERYRPRASSKAYIQRVYEITNNAKCIVEGLQDKRYEELPSRLLQSLNQILIESNARMQQNGLLSFTEPVSQSEVELAAQHSQLETFKLDTEELDPDEKLLITEEEIKDFLQDNIPPFFLNNIQKIKLKYKTPPESQTELGETIGSYVANYADTGRATDSVISIYKYFSTSPDASGLDTASRKRLFLECLVHEIGHNMQDVIGIEDLQEWNRVIKDEPLDITRYTRLSRMRSDDRGAREDFCETLADFVGYPYFVAMVAPQRFDYMQNLFVRYSANDKKSGIFSKYQRDKEFAEIWMSETGLDVNSARKTNLATYREN